MKLTWAFILILNLQMSASVWSQTTTMSVKLNNSTLQELFTKIEKGSEYRFFYNNDEVDVNQRISVDAEDKTIGAILETALKGLPYSFKESENKLIVIERTGEATNPSGVNAQQGKKVSGKVTDSTGGSLPGASVVVKGTTIGAITDSDGNYSLVNVPENATLQFSFVGMKKQEIAIGNKTSVNVTMAEDAIGLDEVVAIGYGTTRKKDVTGSISSIKATEISKLQLGDPAKSLKGKAAGVLVTGDGRPGQNSSILIRGKRSFSATNDPLLVVDGVPVTSSLMDFPSSIIESIEILKDASATAIYGSRAANGVILVTTKNGSYNDKGKIEYNGYYGIQTPFAKADWMNSAQFSGFVRDVYRANGKYTSATPNKTEDLGLSIFTNDPYVKESLLMGYDEQGNYDPSKVRSTNWQDLLLRNGSIASHQISFSGGSKDLRAYISLDYFKNKGISPTDDYDRYNATAKVDYLVNKWLKIGFISNNSRSNNSTLGDAPYGRMNTMNPMAVPYDNDGNIIVQPGGDPLFFNPLLDIEDRTRDNRSTRIVENFFAELNLGYGIKYKLNLGYDATDSRNGEYFGFYSIFGQDKKQNKISDNHGRSENMLMENILSYNNKFGEDHSLGATFVHSIQSFRNESLRVETQASPFNYQLWYNVGAGTSNTTVGSGLTESSLQSYLGRINYAYKDRYLLTASVRIDGSSVFSSGNKYNYFPSFALAWKISKEGFMSDSKVVNDLKLRVGYGRVGNSSISPYSTQGLVAKTNYLFETNRGGSEIAAYGYLPVSLQTKLKWEASAQSNIGLDFSLLNFISGNIDLYYTKTTDLLMNRQLPIVSGFSQVTQNIGSTSNRGIEFSLSLNNLKSAEGLNWTTDLTFAYNNERIEKLYKEGDDVGNKWFIGHPLDIYYDYDTNGLFQEGDADLGNWGPNYKPGDIRIVDRNTNYKADPEDMTIRGNRRPDFFGGLTNNLAYKGFDLNFMLYGKYGNMVRDNKGYYVSGNARDVITVVDYWTPTNTTAKYPASRSGSPGNLDALTLVNGSYLRVTNINFGYTFTKSMINLFKMERLRAYISVQDPHLIWTSKEYTGVDPEYTNSPNDVPNPTTYSFGINASF